MQIIEIIRRWGQEPNQTDITAAVVAARSSNSSPFMRLFREGPGPCQRLLTDISAAAAAVGCCCYGCLFLLIFSSYFVRAIIFYYL